MQRIIAESGCVERAADIVEQSMPGFRSKSASVLRTADSTGCFDLGGDFTCGHARPGLAVGNDSSADGYGADTQPSVTANSHIG